MSRAQSVEKKGWQFCHSMKYCEWQNSFQCKKKMNKKNSIYILQIYILYHRRSMVSEIIILHDVWFRANKNNYICSNAENVTRKVDWKLVKKSQQINFFRQCRKYIQVRPFFSEAAQKRWGVAVVFSQIKRVKKLGFKTPRTMVWCTVHTAQCGPHRTVRIAPALIGQKCPHLHSYPLS